MTHRAVPRQGGLGSLHTPAEEGDVVAHVRTERVHRIAMETRSDERYQGPLILPYGQGPESVSDDFRSECEPDEPGGVFASWAATACAWHMSASVFR